MNHPRSGVFPPRRARMASSDVDIFNSSDECHLLWVMKFGHKPLLIYYICLGTENLKTVIGENSSGIWHVFIDIIVSNWKNVESFLSLVS